MGTHGSIHVCDQDGYKVELHTQSNGQVSCLVKNILDLPDTLVRLSKQEHNNLFFYKMWSRIFDQRKPMKDFGDILRVWYNHEMVDISRSINLASYLILQSPSLYVCHPDFMDKDDYKYNTMSGPVKVTIEGDALGKLYTLVVEFVHNKKDLNDESYMGNFYDELGEIKGRINKINKDLPPDVQIAISPDDKIRLKFDELIAYKVFVGLKEGAENE